MSAQIRIDLITGFLGSGKTTFTRFYCQYLEKTEKVAIIVNDFGAINVDMMMLKDLRSPHLEIEMITAGDKECYSRRLKAKLIALKLQGFTRVVIEPSGIFDINLFLDIIHDSTLEDWYVLNTVIGIVDPTLDYSSDSMHHLLIDEISSSGILIFSKSQLADTQTIEEVKKELDNLFHQYHLSLDTYQLLIKDWHTFTDDDYKYIEESSYNLHILSKEANANYNSLFFFNLSYTKYELGLKIDRLLKSQKIIRIKGFMTLQEGYLVSINVTPEIKEIKPISEGQEVLIVIGEELDENYIKTVLS